MCVVYLFLNSFSFYQAIRLLSRKTVNKYLYLYLYAMHISASRSFDSQTSSPHHIASVTKQLIWYWLKFVLHNKWRKKTENWLELWTTSETKEEQARTVKHFYVTIIQLTWNACMWYLEGWTDPPARRLSHILRRCSNHSSQSASESSDELSDLPQCHTSNVI